VDWRTHIEDTKNMHKINYCMSILNSYIKCDIAQFYQDSYEF